MNRKPGNIEHSILRNVVTEDRPTSNIERRMIQPVMPGWMLNVGRSMFDVQFRPESNPAESVVSFNPIGGMQ
jgi:hypothetical protein